MKILHRYVLLALGVGAMALPVHALDTGIDNFTLNGRLRQGYSVAYDLEGQGNQNGPASYLAEIKSSYTPNRNLTFIGNFWLRGDWSPDWDPLDVQAGIVDPFSPGFSGTLPMTLHEDRCNPSMGSFCSDTDELKTLGEAEDVIRELSVKYRDPKRRYTMKFGKFQRGWGQSDGLRLLDVLHAQDLRERFAFKDSDELRIPALMLATDFNLKKLGMAAPFEALGMRRPTLEFNFVPEVFHSKFIINNPTPSDPSSGGIFGLPFPRLFDPKSGLGLVGLGANLTENTPDNISFKDAEYSMRLKFETLGGEGTINLFYGMQDLPVVKLTGANVIVGDAFNNPANALAVVPVDLATAMAAIWAPVGAFGPTTGGYLPFLRGLTGAGPFSNSPLAALTGGLCFDPTNPLPNTVGCSVTVNFELDYDYRQKMVGFSFARDLGDMMAFGPKSTSPTLRLEVAYEIDKPFNRSTVRNPFDGSVETGSPALVVDPKDAIVESDVVSTMIGFDYPLWIPGWEKQQKSIFTSFQFFNIYTKDADKGLLAQAPYAFTEVEDNQQYTTFLWNAPIMGEALILEGLLIKDLDNQGYFYRQRVDFQFFGNNWRPRLEWMRFDGEPESAPYGVFENSDFVEFSLTYQF